jgi:hypothetical protein
LLEYARITLISVADGIETGTKLSKLTLSVKERGSERPPAVGEPTFALYNLLTHRVLH